ncbi:MAG TPA: CsgG/HfaB family protein [Candidatus Ozemobacteraceae bacterium]|nr:CsgG/HfaB family protein [Candidatus Ozemobacteraceae bacterium]
MLIRNGTAVIIAVLLFLGGAIVPVEARPRLAVLPFTNPPGFDADYPIGAGLAQMLKQRLMEAGKVLIVEREELNAMKDELKLAEDGHFDVSTFPAKGGFQGADYILRGKVLDFGHFQRDTGLGTLGKLAGGFLHTKVTAYVRLSVELIDLRNGRLIFSDNAEARHDKTGAVLLAGDLKKALGAALKLGSSEFDASMIGQATRKALDRVMSKMNALFRLEARVQAVSPDGIVIDMGASSGLKAGQAGMLYGVSEIRNKAGVVVWSSKQSRGSVSVVDVQPDGALVKAPAGVEAHEGDLVSFEAR